MRLGYIKDEVLDSEEFNELSKALGSKDAAIGALWRAWRLAEIWYTKSPNRGIPVNTWHAYEINAEIRNLGFAAKVGDQIMMVGLNEQFEQILKKPLPIRRIKLPTAHMDEQIERIYAN